MQTAYYQKFEDDEEDDVLSVLAPTPRRESFSYLDTNNSSLGAEALKTQIDITPIQELIIEYPKNDTKTFTKLQTRDSFSGYGFPQNNFMSSGVRKWFYDHRRTPIENIMMILNLQYLTSNRQEEKEACQNWDLYVQYTESQKRILLHSQSQARTVLNRGSTLVLRKRSIGPTKQSDIVQSINSLRSNGQQIKNKGGLGIPHQHGRKNNPQKEDQASSNKHFNPFKVSTASKTIKKPKLEMVSKPNKKPLFAEMTGSHSSYDRSAIGESYSHASDLSKLRQTTSQVMQKEERDSNRLKMESGHSEEDVVDIFKKAQQKKIESYETYTNVFNPSNNKESTASHSSTFMMQTDVKNKKNDSNVFRKQADPKKKNSIINRLVPTQKKAKKVPVRANKKQREVSKGDRIESSCGQYQASVTNEAYFVDIAAVEFLKQSQNEVYLTLQDFQNKVIRELNKIQSKVKYQASITPKYLKLSCTCCKKFQMWYKNVLGKDLGLLDMQRINVKFFRSINQNHNKADHRGISFDKPESKDQGKRNSPNMAGDSIEKSEH